HGAAGGAAGDQVEVGVDHAHGAGGLVGDAPVLGGGALADLPRAVHLIAQAPQLDAVGFVVAVGAAQLRPVGAAGVVGVLEEVEGLLEAAGAEVDGHVRLDADGAAE